MGRFITPDWAAKATAVPYAELSDPQTLNLYSYVRNRPTAVADPNGHKDKVDGCTEAQGCFVTVDKKAQTMTITQTSTQTVVSKDANGNQISTTTRTTNTETVSTANTNRGQVLGGSTTTNTTTVNLTDKSAVSETTPAKNLTPLQAMNAVGPELTKGLQDSAQPSAMERLWDHKVGAGGAVLAGAGGVCALAEPCGAIVGTGALIGTVVVGTGAAIYDFATH
jgi:hypothetical protein